MLSGVKEIRKVIDTAREQRRLHARRTILFVDEIHRFNKAQQDAFLHHVEKGLIVLVGATTENPSFEVIPALVSRCRVVALKRLNSEQIHLILERALADRDRGLGDLNLDVSREALITLHGPRMGMCVLRLPTWKPLPALPGGSRRMGEIKTPSQGLHLHRSCVSPWRHVEQAVQKKALRYDKGGDQHFKPHFGLHKSLRGSDPDGALYWMTRMIAAGEDPLYVLRRMVRFAVEDVGLARPRCPDRCPECP